MTSKYAVLLYRSIMTILLSIAYIVFLNDIIGIVLVMFLLLFGEAQFVILFSKKEK